jgi:Ca2+-binding RTX toxin-like protein
MPGFRTGSPISLCDPNGAIVGNDGPDTLNGTPGDDVIIGAGGQDTIYGNGGNDLICGGEGNDVIHGGDGDDILEGGVGTDGVDGGAGFDVAEYMDSAGPVVASLQAGTGGGDTLSAVEALVGSAFGGDALTGDSETNLLVGWIGNDAIDGGGGVDFVASFGPGTVDLAERKTGGADGVDDLSRIEGAVGSDGNDALYGDAADNLFAGGQGDDVIVGRGGGDTLEGNEGADKVRGGDGADNLEGGPGADRLDGGNGSEDAAVFSASPTAVIVDLRDGSAHGAGSDVVANIETVVGSSFDDHLYGDSGDDHLEGGFGADVLIGRGGADWLEGGDGPDILKGGTGNDLLDGGEGADSGSGGDGSDACLSLDNTTCDVALPPGPTVSATSSAAPNPQHTDAWSNGNDALAGPATGIVQWSPASCLVNQIALPRPASVSPTIDPSNGQSVWWRAAIGWWQNNRWNYAFTAGGLWDPQWIHGIIYRRASYWINGGLIDIDWEQSAEVQGWNLGSNLTYYLWQQVSWNNGAQGFSYTPWTLTKFIPGNTISCISI